MGRNISTAEMCFERWNETHCFNVMMNCMMKIFLKIKPVNIRHEINNIIHEKGLQ